MPKCAFSVHQNKGWKLLYCIFFHKIFLICKNKNSIYRQTSFHVNKRSPTKIVKQANEVPVLDYQAWLTESQIESSVSFIPQCVSWSCHFLLKQCTRESSFFCEQILFTNTTQVYFLLSKQNQVVLTFLFNTLLTPKRGHCIKSKMT